jgi:hypothetical protein
LHGERRRSQGESPHRHRARRFDWLGRPKVLAVHTLGENDEEWRELTDLIPKWKRDQVGW